MNHRVWITNNAAGTIYVYDDQGNFLFQLGDESIRRNAQPGYFEKPEAIAFGNGYAYVTDTGNQYPGDSPRVKILDALTGTQVGTINGQSKGVVVDPVTGFVYVALAANRITAFPAAGGAARFSVGSAGTGNGQFTGLWDVAIIGRTLYASDNAQSRITAFTIPATGAPTFLGRWGAFGTNPYQFRNPSGMTVDANGLLYVADATNDRIVVFNPAVAKPAYEFSAPVAHRHVARERRHHRRPRRDLRLGDGQHLGGQRGDRGPRPGVRQVVGADDRHVGDGADVEPGAVRRRLAHVRDLVVALRRRAVRARLPRGDPRSRREQHH